MLLAAPAVSFAQNHSWNVAVSGGVVLNTATSNSGRGELPPSHAGGVAGVQVGYRSGHWEYGLSSSFRRYSVRIEKALKFEDQFDPLTGYSTGEDVIYDWTETLPAITIAPFVARHFGKGRADWYAGVSAGYAIMLQEQVGMKESHEYIRTKGYKNGVTAGLRAGLAYPLGKHLSVTGELSVEGLWLQQFNLQAAAATAGFRYRFGKK